MHHIHEIYLHKLVVKPWLHAPLFELEECSIEIASRKQNTQPLMSNKRHISFIVFPFCVCIRTVENHCFSEVQHAAIALSHCENTMPLISTTISKTVTYLVRARGWDNRECFIWGLALVLEEKQITPC